MVIGNKTFIGAAPIVLPGVTIGRSVVIGAGSVVTRDIPDNVVAAGNPARVLCTLDEYLERQSALMETRPRYPQMGWTQGRGITDDRKREMIAALRDGPGFVE